jgi:hypothetical protein
MRLLSLFILLFVQSSFAQNEKLQDEKELEVVDFSSIKKVLQQDGLSEAVKKKEKQIKAIKSEQIKIENERYVYPSENELWEFASEYWLIKNAQILNWDFEKPDYGLEKSFAEVMERLGFYQKKFKILLINSPTLVKTALPGNEAFILILSVPFIRSLDLSKLEISLILFEEFVRLEQGYFKQNTSTEKMRSLVGTNFQGRKADISMVEELLKKYHLQIFEKGFNFQQMFEVTKKVDAYLKSSPELWNAYFGLIGKIDRFVKSNTQYKDYVKLFPSPEMQIKWLSPEEKNL